MELNRLYDIADRENIGVIDFKMKNKAIIGNLGRNYMIGLNYSKIKENNEEKTLLAEELGHYYCDAMYNEMFSKEEISKNEFRANKWAFKTLCPLYKLEELSNKGYKYYYEYAEALGVTEDLVEKAYNYYKAN